MIYATEASDNLRAVISSLKGLFKQQSWEYEVSSQLRNLWLTDCQSLRDYLVNPIRAGCEDKRLEIDLDGLREDLWEYESGELKDSIEEDQFNKPRWIDTSTMICDPLTKHGNEAFSQRLVDTMQTGRLDLKATAASEIKKMRQQKARLNKITKVESDELEV